MLTIPWLDAFLTLARTRNFSRAAETLYVTQPAFSRTIAEIEQKAGYQLFDRNTRPVSLTKEGEVFYRWACLLERNLQDMGAELRDTEKEALTRIRIGFYGDTQMVFLNRGIDTMRQNVPNLSWSLVRDNPTNLIQKLESGDIDLSVLSLPAAKAHPMLDYRTLAKGGLGVLLPSAHPLSGRNELNIREIKDEPYVGFPRDDSPQAYDLEMQPFLDIHAIPRVQAVAENFDAIGILVAQGIGISVMSLASAETFHRNGLPVAVVPLAEYNEGFDMVLAWKSDSENHFISLFLNSIGRTFDSQEIL